ncbi:hypothetical protein TRIUR3_19472 [Triticum urartu]|uniref:Uncharacterized protein n=1 Tax=Triticum urartu TaxID=4572 RepID=M7ZU97_TRIUA|nr:hypothetical protein TRIUR3_19472 [Triticum urartu]
MAWSNHRDVYIIRCLSCRRQEQATATKGEKATAAQAKQEEALAAPHQAEVHSANHGAHAKEEVLVARHFARAKYEKCKACDAHDRAEQQ